MKQKTKVLMHDPTNKQTNMETNIHHVHAESKQASKQNMSHHYASNLVNEMK